MPEHGQDEDGNLVIALPGDPMHPEPERACEFARVVLRNRRWVGEG